jgi:GNAT superfamily N-acetyltransferase
MAESMTSFFRRTAAVEPDFDHEEIDTGGSKRPTKIHLHALDPDTGDRMGTLTYHVPRRKADKILIEHLGTEDDHRRKGVGSALMDEMQRRHPGTPIDHGDRTEAGKAWWAGYTDGKKVTRGRTMASRPTYFHGSPDHIPVGQYIEPGHSKNFDVSSSHHVYLTDSAQEARNWGEDAHDMRATEGPVYVHEVEPEGPVKRHEVHEDGELDFVEYHAPRARVVRVTRHGSADTPVPNNTEPYQHEHPWLPHDHFFAPGRQDLDARLFGGDHMHPQVRQHLLSLLHSFWAPRYGDSWQTWARVYLAGSEASHFYGNGDLDILIGVDYDTSRAHVPALASMSNEEISIHLTDELRHGLNDDARMLPGPGGETGPWENTWYVNPDSYDIRAIKPYAAYDITRDEWAVRPVEVPADFGPEKLPESTWDVFEAVQTLIKAIGELPAGTREREGAALYDYLHADRHSAFGPEGSGLYDPANAVWKALDKAPDAPLQQLIDWKHAHDGVAATTQENAA